MGQLFSSTNLFLEVCIIAMLALAIVVFRHAKERISDKLFSLFILAGILWVFTNLMANFALFKNESVLLFWTKVSLVGPALMPLLLITFSNAFVEGKITLKKGYIWILGIITFFIIILIPTKLNVEAVKIIDPYAMKSTFSPGPLYTIFSLYFLFGIFASAYLLIKKYLRASRIEKLQIKYILIGLASSILFGVLVNAILPMLGYSRLINIGPASSIFFISFTAYAIVETHLFDIRVIATEVLVVLIGLALLIDTLLSTTLLEGGLKGILFVLMSYGSYKLVQSVKEEIRRRQEIQKLTTQLKKDKEELQSLDRLKDEFLQMATHELNMPIASIQSGVSILEEMGEKDSTKRKIVDSINFNTQRLAALARDLLNVSRIESGRLSTNFSEVQLEDLIKQVVNDLEEKAKNKGNQLRYVKVQKPLHKIYSDEGKIVQILNNLIGNAIKFTENGKITVSAQREDDKIITTVSDTGVGIPKEALPKLFTKFYQVDRFNKDKPLEQQGTGLGLYITKKLVELLGGKIWVQSQEDKGSQFSFSLPIKNKRYNENEQKN